MENSTTLTDSHKVVGVITEEINRLPDHEQMLREIRSRLEVICERIGNYPAVNEKCKPELVGVANGLAGQLKDHSDAMSEIGVDIFQFLNRS